MERFINEAAPYMDFAHAMIDGQNSGVTHIPCWLITDIRSFHRYVVAGHLPIPKIPFAPVPTVKLTSTVPFVLTRAMEFRGTP